jgi:prepilin-type N-terminal cleavage/methylation domain-containing protein
MRRNYLRARARGGYNLLEVLIGMVVLAIGLVSAFELTMMTSRLVQRSQFLAQATALAEYKLEELRNADYDTIATGADGSTLDALGNNGGIYTRSWTVQADAPATGLKTVAVHVTWSQFGQTQDVRLTGVIGQ